MHRRRGNSRQAFTIVELLVVIAIIGMLVGLLLPAVHAARESGRRSVCMNNLKQVGIAIHAFHHARRQLPTSNRPMGVATAPRLSWATQLLPYIEQQNIYDEYDFARNWSNNEPPQSPRKLTNAQLSSVRIPVLECPTSPDAGALDGDVQYWTEFKSTGVKYANWEESRCAAPTNYSPIVQVEARVYTGLGIMAPSDTSGMMQRNTICTIDQVSDGSSNTIMLVESAGRPFVFRRGVGKVGGLSANRVNGGGWARPASDFGLDGSLKDGTIPGPCAINCTNGEDYVHGAADNGPPIVPIPFYDTYSTAETYSFHNGGANILFGDSAVRFIDESVDMEVFTQLVTRRGREVIRGILLN